MGINSADLRNYFRNVAARDFEATNWTHVQLGPGVHAFIDPREKKATIYQDGRGELGHYDFASGALNEEKPFPYGIMSLSFRSTNSLGVREPAPKRPSELLDEDLAFGRI